MMATITNPINPMVTAALDSPDGACLPVETGVHGGVGAPGAGGKELPSRSLRPPGARNHRQRDEVPSRFIFGVAKEGSATVFVIIFKKKKKKTGKKK